MEHHHHRRTEAADTRQEASTMDDMINRVMRAFGWTTLEETAEQTAFENELRALGGDDAQRSEWRKMAIFAGQAGLTSSEEFALALSRGMNSTMTRMRDLDWARGKTDDQIDRRRQQIWDES